MSRKQKRNDWFNSEKLFSKDGFAWKSIQTSDGKLVSKQCLIGFVLAKRVRTERAEGRDVWTCTNFRTLIKKTLFTFPPEPYGCEGSFMARQCKQWRGAHWNTFPRKKRWARPILLLLLIEFALIKIVIVLIAQDWTNCVAHAQRRTNEPREGGHRKLTKRVDHVAFGVINAECTIVERNSLVLFQVWMKFFFRVSLLSSLLNLPWTIWQLNLDKLSQTTKMIRVV